MLEKKILKIIPFIIPFLILFFWQLISHYQWLDERYLRNVSSPYAIALAGWKIIQSGEIYKHLWASTQRAFLGLLLGGGLGFLLGVYSGLSKWGFALINSPLQMLRNIPHFALIPLVILWFGVEESGKIFLVALGTFFPIYLNTYHGVHHSDPSLVEMAKSYGLSGFQLFKEVVFPGALPNILVGLRFSLGIMWLTLIVAETISTDTGIGYLSVFAREFLQIDLVMFTVLLYATLGVLADFIVKKIEIHFLHWNLAYQENKS